MAHAASSLLRFATVPDGQGGHRHVLRQAPPAPKRGSRHRVPDPIEASAESAAQQLKQIIEHAETLLGEIAEKQAELAEHFGGAAGQGFNPKIIKTIIARRRKDRDALLQEDAILDTYQTALGLA